MKPRTSWALALTTMTGVLAVAGTLMLAAPFVFAEEAATVVVLSPDVWRFGLLAAALSTGLSSVGAAYAVGKVGSAATGALAEKPELFGRLIILVGLAEGIAIYGLIVSVLILNRLV